MQLRKIEYDGVEFIEATHIDDGTIFHGPGGSHYYVNELGMNPLDSDWPQPGDIIKTAEREYAYYTVIDVIPGIQVGSNGALVVYQPTIKCLEYGLDPAIFSDKSYIQWGHWITTNVSYVHFIEDDIEIHSICDGVSTFVPKIAVDIPGLPRMKMNISVEQIQDIAWASGRSSYEIIGDCVVKQFGQILGKMICEKLNKSMR